MDIHARVPSQFANRRPKGGPPVPNTRHREREVRPMAGDHFSPKSRPFDTSSKTAPSSPRPIATNSRILKNERQRKDMYLAFVNNALQEKATDKSDTFDELVDQFNPLKLQNDALAAGHLKLWLAALSHVVSQLQRIHAPLVDAIINFSWETLDSTFVNAYSSFIVILVTARPEYLTRVLERITRGLTHQAGIQMLDLGGAETSSNPLTRRGIYDRVHELLRHLLDAIPTLPSTLQPTLVRFFPHKRQSQICQVTYIRNLLRISHYCPALSDRILSTIIDRAMQIDVEIQVELEELEAFGLASPIQDIFELDPFDHLVREDSESDDDEDVSFSDISSDAGDGEEDTHAATQTDAIHVQEMVGKLDAILKLLFDHFDNSTIPAVSSVSPPDTLSVDLLHGSLRDFRRPQFLVLLSIFAQSILHTFKSRYTQFLVFWYASLDAEFSDLFQGLLISKALLELEQPIVTRAAAASYIASYVSRATFVDKEATRRVVAVLCQCLSDHLDMIDNITVAGVPSPGSIQHGIFYAIAQAVFLIFCFRWRDLLDGDDEPIDTGATRQWIPELSAVQRAINSSLNPLKVCTPNVVLQFARVAKSTGFVYCYSILEANKRMEHGGLTPVASRQEGFDADMNTFFPFDPYRLPNSSSYVERVYREWTAVAIEEDGDEEEGDDQDEEEGDHHSETDVGGVHQVTVSNIEISKASDEDHGLGLSFGGMSISPAAPI